MISRAKIAFAALLVAAIHALSLSAYAKSVQDYEAMSADAQAEYVVSFLEKMTYDIGQKDPELARQIKDYFVRDAPGKPFSEGIERLTIELAVIDNLARQGKADLSKIQIEGVIVTVTKRRFQPNNKS